MYKLILGIALVLLLASCEKEKQPAPNPVEKTFDLSGFNRIRAGETYRLTIKYGPGFSILAKGGAEDLADLVMSIEQSSTLFIRYSRFRRDRYRVDIEITLPWLLNLNLFDAATGALTGFEQQNSSLRMVLSGTAQCAVTGLPATVQSSLYANSMLTLSGTSDELLASLQGGARLQAYNASFATADVYTDSKATARFRVQNSLVALASGDSRIYYKGSPASVNIEEEGLGKVIRE